MSELDEVRAEARPGVCMFCEERFNVRAHGRNRRQCESVECRRSYHRLYKRQRKTKGPA